MKAMASRFALIILAFAAFVAAPVFANDLPKSVKKGASYDKVRNAMVKAGYKPLPDIAERAIFCDASPSQCEPYPEAEACAGTGLAPCIMVWSKGRGGVKIYTQGEPKLIRSIEKQR
jgi:hypothetical protein